MPAQHITMPDLSPSYIPLYSFQLIASWKTTGNVSSISVPATHVETWIEFLAPDFNLSLPCLL